MATGLTETTSLSPFGKTISLPCSSGHAHLCQLSEESAETDTNGSVTHSPDIIEVSFTAGLMGDVAGVLDAIHTSNLAVRRSSDPLKDIQSSDQVVLVLDEMFAPVMDSPDETQWHILKHIVQTGCRLLWVTSGAQLDVTNPTQAAIIGDLRTIRAEEDLRLITLDVQSPHTKTASYAIASCLKQLSSDNPVNSAKSGERQPSDFKYVEGDGVVRICRLIPDVRARRGAATPRQSPSA